MASDLHGERDPLALAKALSKAQRETLFDNRRCVRHYAPAQKLVELGIWDGSGDEYTIYSSRTPLGNAVLAHLKPNGGE